LPVPLLTLLCGMALLGRLAARWFNDEVVALSCLMIGLSPPILPVHSYAHRSPWLADCAGAER